MEESSETLAPKGKVSTRATRKLTEEEALQILEDAILAYQKAGGKVEIVPDFYFEGQNMVAVLLSGVLVKQKHLVPVVAQE